MIVGFIGTGTITAHMVRGLKASVLADWPVVLSPRNSAMAASLAGLPGVRVAKSNQAALEAAQLVVLAVRPQVAEAVIKPLIFKPETPVISLIAATPHARLAAWTGARHIARAIPLPFVERLAGATPVFPPLPEAMQLFAALGGALPVTDVAAFDAYAATSSLMATYFGLVETAATWMQGQGVDAADATSYLRHLFGDLGDTLRRDSAALDHQRENHATRGGLNEQAHEVFMASGGGAALEAGLNAVMARIRAAGA